MRLQRGRLRDLARQRVDILLENALKNASEDIRLAQRQAAMARRICLKYNLRLPYSKRMFYCRGCKKMIVPGVNARVRLSARPKAVKITCLQCGHTYRKIIENSA